jgi:hypothetical protein
MDRFYPYDEILKGMHHNGHAKRAGAEESPAVQRRAINGRPLLNWPPVYRPLVASGRAR